MQEKGKKAGNEGGWERDSIEKFVQFRFISVLSISTKHVSKT